MKPPAKILVQTFVALILISAMMGLQTQTVSAKPVAQATNLALNKPVTCSPSPQFPCAEAVDGNTGTRWASAQGIDPQWIYVDLGATNTITSVTLNWEAAYATSYQIQTSPDASAWTNIYTTTTGNGGIDTLTVSGSGRYVRMYGTVRATAYGYSLWEFEIYGAGGATATPTRTNTPSGPTATPTRTNTPSGPTATPTRTATPGGACAEPASPNWGSNVRIWEDSTADSTIQASLDTDFNNMKDTLVDQFSEERVAHLFKSGSYNVNINVPFYMSVQGLGQNPTGVNINGYLTVDAFNASDAGNATQNFWRSAENLTVNVPGGGATRWAVAQAAPFRRIKIVGDLDLYPASYGWASGGYISDSRISGNVESASQQQWYSKDSNYGSWTGSNWNMVFSGVTGAPAASFPAPPMTVLSTTPFSRDVPYLYWNGSAWMVFKPNLRTNASGASWSDATPTAGTSVAITQFYVALPGVTAATLNSKLSAGCNLIFTPGIYHVNQTLNVNNANTVILGLGLPTVVNDSGVNAMQVANVDGVRIKGLFFDAGTTLASTQLTVGTSGNTTSHASNPVTVQDVFFRVGGQFAGKIDTSMIVHAYDTIIDHTWIWRADHGAGVGWTSNTAEEGLIVNGNNVLATGLFVEHYQKYEVMWNGQNGKIIFFQNEKPYDPPNQAAYMNGSIKGYASIKVANTVTTFEAWGLGAYCYFLNAPQNTTIVADMAFEAPNTANVKWHNMSTVSLGYYGAIVHPINTTGPQTPTNSTPATVTTYP